MRRVELFELIRRDFFDQGLSKREIARKHGVHRRAVRQAIASAVPAERRCQVRTHPVLTDEAGAFVDGILLADRRAPRKQRHTVQMDCFFIGRLSGAKGAVWQYTAIDVASAHCWAELHLTPRNPSARWTSELARRVAADLASRGWSLEKVMSDNASEFRSAEFEQALARVGARHLFEPPWVP
jgi:transposase InsO family protein